ncbi:MAG: DUF11 domain-containing protein, partial [Lentisphaerae bacterium]|nr:DUF11 domain-containing protein [Lentisphaerota bacterium]
AVGGGVLSTNEIAEQVTDSNGNYSFSGLLPGDYVVRVDVPSGATATKQFSGEDRAIDSDGNAKGWSGLVTVDSGDNDTTVDFGFVWANASVGDRFWFDADNNGLQDEGEVGVAGGRVQLLYADGTAVRDSYGRTIVTSSDASGFYRLQGLVPGTYRLAFTPPSGYLLTTQDADSEGVGGAANSSPDPTTGLSAPFTLVEGQYRETLDAGLVRGAAIGDRVWVDTNGNGLQDADEPGYNGAVVRLLDGSGNQLYDDNGYELAVTTRDHPETGAPGYYLFSGLRGGSYRVAVDILGGVAAFTLYDADGAGVRGGANSDLDPVTGITAPFELHEFEQLLAVDIGLLARLGITKNASTAGPVQPGDTITYTVVVTNGGATAQSHVQVVDQLPPRHQLCARQSADDRLW